MYTRFLELTVGMKRAGRETSGGNRKKKKKGLYYYPIACFVQVGLHFSSLIPRPFSAPVLGYITQLMFCIMLQNWRWGKSGVEANVFSSFVLGFGVHMFSFWASQDLFISLSSIMGCTELPSVVVLMLAGRPGASRC